MGFRWGGFGSDKQFLAVRIDNVSTIKENTIEPTVRVMSEWHGFAHFSVDCFAQNWETRAQGGRRLLQLRARNWWRCPTCLNIPQMGRSSTELLLDLWRARTWWQSYWTSYRSLSLWKWSAIPSLPFTVKNF
jgi:hypothetical protein